MTQALDAVRDGLVVRGELPAGGSNLTLHKQAAAADVIDLSHLVGEGGTVVNNVTNNLGEDTTELGSFDLGTGTGANLWQDTGLDVPVDVDWLLVKPLLSWERVSVSDLELHSDPIAGEASLRASAELLPTQILRGAARHILLNMGPDRSLYAAQSYGSNPALSGIDVLYINESAGGGGDVTVVNNSSRWCSKTSLELGGIRILTSVVHATG